jgi:hypothetical protein
MDTPQHCPVEGAAWSFNHFGLFYSLQRQLGLLDETDLAVGRRALIFAAVSFVPALLLAALQGCAWSEHPQRAMLLDFSAYAQVIAIAAFIVMEQVSYTRMKRLVHGFSAHGLLTPTSGPGFLEARRRMERRAGTPWVEITILALAYWIAHQWLFQLTVRIDGGTWAGQVIVGHLHLTMAGIWVQVVSLPLLLFLLGRWIWRFVVWGLLLRDVSRCELRLVATHADRCGGLAFIGHYPSTYMLFVFAVSTVVSAGVLKQVVYGGVNVTSFKFAAVGMVGFMVVAFVVPLLAFTPVLIRLKRNGLHRYGALVSRHNLAFDQKWCGGNGPDATEALGAPDISSLADLATGYDLVKRMLPLPLSREGFMPLVLATILPMAVVAATQLPVKEVMDELKTVLFI